MIIGEGYLLYKLIACFGIASVCLYLVMLLPNFIQCSYYSEAIGVGSKQTKVMRLM